MGKLPSVARRGQLCTAPDQIVAAEVMLTEQMHFAATMLIAGDILGLGDAPSSFGQTLALALTFLGIGIIANVLIVYAIAQVLAERKENHERMRRLHERQRPH